MDVAMTLPFTRVYGAEMPYNKARYVDACTKTTAMLPTATSLSHRDFSVSPSVSPSFNLSLAHSSCSRFRRRFYLRSLSLSHHLLHVGLRKSERAKVSAVVESRVAIRLALTDPKRRRDRSPERNGIFVMRAHARKPREASRRSAISGRDITIIYVRASYHRSLREVAVNYARTVKQNSGITRCDVDFRIRAALRYRKKHRDSAARSHERGTISVASSGRSNNYVSIRSYENDTRERIEMPAVFATRYVYSRRASIDFTRHSSPRAA